MSSVVVCGTEGALRQMVNAERRGVPPLQLLQTVVHATHKYEEIVPFRSLPSCSFRCSPKFAAQHHDAVLFTSVHPASCSTGVFSGDHSLEVE